MKLNCELKTRILPFLLLSLVCVNGYSLRALPSYKGCSDVKVGITVFFVYKKHSYMG